MRCQSRGRRSAATWQMVADCTSRSSPSSAKSWVFRYRNGGRLREMGLGSTHTLSLAEARDAALSCRKQRLIGIDPIEARHGARAADRLAAARAMTFQQCAEAYMKAHRAAWRNEKHAWQWGQTLSGHVYPVIGALPVAAIDTGHVTRILEPIWSTKAETAARVRGRIEAILDYAKVHGWRTGENPGRWKGHLENVLPARGKVSKVEHHAALPWAEIGAFMAELRDEDGVSARALEFTILTAARTGEVIGAMWPEIEMKAALWTVPATRMKGLREHRVPLSDAALAVLKSMAPLRDDQAGGWVFPGGRVGRPLSNMGMMMLLRRMMRPNLTVHGFRSSFRDWCAEATNHPREVAEQALAHSLSDKVEAAYRRGDLFEKRRRLMEDWASFCARLAEGSADVVSIRA